MKVKWLEEADPLSFYNGKIYKALGYAWDATMLDVIDETGDNYLYPVECFEIVEE